jgi:hypothetical protein
MEFSLELLHGFLQERGLVFLELDLEEEVERFVQRQMAEVSDANVLDADVAGKWVQTAALAGWTGTGFEKGKEGVFCFFLSAFGKQGKEGMDSFPAQARRVFD